VAWYIGVSLGVVSIFVIALVVLNAQCFSVFIKVIVEPVGAKCKVVTALLKMAQCQYLEGSG
jgi:hypothetical protein